MLLFPLRSLRETREFLVGTDLTVFTQKLEVPEASRLNMSPEGRILL